jgi:hypothetical protein
MESTEYPNYYELHNLFMEPSEEKMYFVNYSYHYIHKNVHLLCIILLKIIWFV